MTAPTPSGIPAGQALTVPGSANSAHSAWAVATWRLRIQSGVQVLRGLMWCLVCTPVLMSRNLPGCVAQQPMDRDHRYGRSASPSDHGAVSFYNGWPVAAGARSRCRGWWAASVQRYQGALTSLWMPMSCEVIGWHAQHHPALAHAAPPCAQGSGSLPSRYSTAAVSIAPSSAGKGSAARWPLHRTRSDGGWAKPWKSRRSWVDRSWRAAAAWSCRGEAARGASVNR